MGLCVGHEPCPQCGSRDNLGRYDDGGAWCFGCGYLEPPTHFRPREQKKKDSTPPPEDLTEMLPEVNKEWLRQYLDDAEIDRWFQYSPTIRRHMFIHTDKDNKVYWEARSVVKKPDGSFGHEHPKTISHGEKPFLILGPWRATHKVVFVEDIVSAIKISRHVGAFPLFGAHISTRDMLLLANAPAIQEVIIWLDSNKYKEAMEFAHRMGRYKQTRVVYTDKDPKDQSDEDIREALELV